MKKTAIVIDDEINLLTVFCDLLDTLGFEILATGCDGNDAVVLYEAHRPDLVFLDIMMPKFDGIYAIKEIQKINPNAVIVIVTADVGEETQKALSDLGIKYKLEKPFSITDLSEVLSNFE